MQVKSKTLICTGAWRGVAAPFHHPLRPVHNMQSCLPPQGTLPCSALDLSSGGVHELCEACFSGCKNLTRVTFGASSTLERIGVGAFRDSGLCEIQVPDTVHEVCEAWFYSCENLTCVTFGASSSLELIGARAFYESGLCEIHIPDSVRELCEA